MVLHEIADCVGHVGRLEFSFGGGSFSPALWKCVFPNKGVFH